VAPWTTDPCSTDGTWTRVYLYPCPTTTTVAPSPAELPVTGVSSNVLTVALIVGGLGAILAALGRRKDGGL
jgi:LPXTG-motif cell wall-anchored protein